MSKYVIFISSSGGKAVPKELVTYSFTRDMKKKGFRKHHIEVEAESEEDAVKELNKFNEGFMKDVKEYTGSIIIISVCVILTLIVYLFSGAS